MSVYCGLSITHHAPEQALSQNEVIGGVQRFLHLSVLRMLKSAFTVTE
ncbi:MAG: hypothetical protein HFH60_11275 [Lachnospiraceae bacterium]|nr:hypothetical protein [Lachnospiraceae bacterium]